MRFIYTFSGENLSRSLVLYPTSQTLQSAVLQTFLRNVFHLRHDQFDAHAYIIVCVKAIKTSSLQSDEYNRVQKKRKKKERVFVKVTLCISQRIKTDRAISKIGVNSFRSSLIAETGEMVEVSVAADKPG